MATKGTISTSHTTRPWRPTPLIRSTALSRAAGCNIYLKLENLQPSGSFKSRGIGNFMLSALRQNHHSNPATPTQKSAQNPSESSHPTHFYSSSGGNAGLACVHAAASLSCASTIVVPMSTSAYMVAKMRTAGAREVVQIGESWADADRHLRETVLVEARERGENAVYVPPFDHENIWEGNSTLVDEVVVDFRGEVGGGVGGEIEGDGDGMQDPEAPPVGAKVPDAIVCSVGGGGLFCGIMQGLDRHGLGEKIKVLALETRGADSLSAALLAKSHITLPAITSIATTLGARQVAKQAYEQGQRKGVKSLVLDDRDAVLGCLRLADEERLIVEPSCGVCVAMCYDGRLKEAVEGFTKESNVVIVVCGGSGVSVEMMEKWRQQYTR